MTARKTVINQRELADWTDELLEDQDRAGLIAIIRAYPDAFTYGVRKTVFHMELVGEIFGTGLLGKIDELGAQFLKLLAAEQPTVKQSYGKIEFEIYEDETTLRYHIRDKAKRARADRDAAAEKAAADAEMAEH